MGGLAILFVALPFLAESPAADGVDWSLVEMALTAFFFAEFFTRLAASYDRFSHLQSHWIDAVALIPVVRGIRIARAGVGISVGFAELEPGDTADGLTERADAAMLGVKAARRVKPQPTLSGQ